MRAGGKTVCVFECGCYVHVCVVSVESVFVIVLCVCVHVNVCLRVNQHNAFSPENSSVYSGAFPQLPPTSCFLCVVSSSGHVFHSTHLAFPPACLLRSSLFLELIHCALS